MACARKLLTVVWSVLKNDQPFTESAEDLKKARREADMLLEAAAEEE